MRFASRLASSASQSPTSRRLLPGRQKFPLNHECIDTVRRVTTLPRMAQRASPTTVRLDDKMNARIAALMPRLQASPYGDLGELSQSKVLRLAILRGLDVLEAEVRAQSKAE